MDKLLLYLKTLKLGAFSGTLSSTLTGPQQLFFFLILLFVFLYGMSVGKTRAIVSLLAIFVALVLTIVFPYLPQLKSALHLEYEEYLVRMGLFLALYVAVFFVLGKSALKNRLTLGEMAFGHVVVVSILQLGLFAAVLASFVPKNAIPHTLTQVYPYFGTPIALFAWSAISVASLPFLKSRRHRDEF